MTDKLKEYMDDLEEGWIHWSHIYLWRWCKRAFKLSYIEGEKRPSSIPMVIGTHFHYFANKFHNTFKVHDFEEFNRLNDLINWLFKKIDYMSSNIPNILKMYFERFIVFEARRYWYLSRIKTNADELFSPYKTEYNLRWKDGLYGRTGTIDCIFFNRKTRIVTLREYKVSKKLNISNVRGQLTYYKSMIEGMKLFGDDVSFRFELYNPLLDNSMFPLQRGTFERSRSGMHTAYWFFESPLKVTETYLNKHWHKFVETVESGYYPKVSRNQIDYKCVYCNFYGLCWGRY